MPILNWLLRLVVPNITVVPSWSDPRRVARPRADLAGRIRVAIELNPCDLVFVHRDAEGQHFGLRRTQIRDAVSNAGIAVPAVGVVPVRMQEAWLLFDENAIRRAAGNPRGTVDLGLPDARRLEDVPDPKSVLHEALRKATDLSTRRKPLYVSPGFATWYGTSQATVDDPIRLGYSNACPRCCGNARSEERRVGKECRL